MLIVLINISIFLFMLVDYTFKIRVSDMSIDEYDDGAQRQDQGSVRLLALLY